MNALLLAAAHHATQTTNASGWAILIGLAVLLAAWLAWKRRRR